MRAQYEGYEDIAGVAPGSMTETYFKLTFNLKEIAVTLESGKRFKEARKGVEVTLKQRPGMTAVRVHIDLEPAMRICIHHADGREEVLFANAAAHEMQYAGQYAEVIVDAFLGRPNALRIGARSRRRVALCRLHK